MKNKIVISIITAVLLGVGVFLYSTNSKFKNFIQNQVIGKSKGETPSKEFWIYCLADGTYSRNTDYAIPQIDTTIISRLIDSIHINGSGKFWLSYIDKDSKNNNCMYFSIPTVTNKEATPIERNGESSFDFQDRLKKWKENTSGFSNDSIKRETKYFQKKNDFLLNCNSLLKDIIYVKSNENRFSDVIGTLNSTFKAFTSNSNSNTQKYIVAFSDLQQDTPNLDPQPMLDFLPESVSLIATNPAPGSSNKCTEDVEEVDSPERVFETIFKR